MNRRALRDPGDPVLLALSGVVLAVAALVLPPSVRWLLTPAVLLLPGHALVCALFGGHLEFRGVRRVCLSVLLSLATYCLLALAVSSLQVPMSAVTVAVSTALFMAGCAAVVEIRRRRTPTAPAPSGTGIELRQLAAPAAAMAASLLVVWAGVHVLPRAEPEPFSAAAFDGPWALVSSVVPVDTGSSETVQVRVWNHTTHPATYRVEAAVQGGPPWSATTVEVRPGRSRAVTVTGSVGAGACRARLAIDVRPSTGHPLDALTLYLRDSSAVCTG